MGLMTWWAERNGYIKRDQLRLSRRAFDAAKTGRLFASWESHPRPIDGEIKAALTSLRARSREQAQNNAYLHRYFDLLKTNVIGANGIQLQGRVRDSGRETLDDAANTAIEEAWQDWGGFGSADVSGSMSWKDIQDNYITTLAQDGETLIEVHRGWSGNKWRFALEYLDCELLDVQLNRDLANGRAIRMGVEMDAYRRPVAYHLTAAPKATSPDTYTATTGQKYRRVPAANILHDFMPTRAFQSRGYPWVAPTLVDMQMLGGYREAELVAARTAASKAGFYEQGEDGQPYQGDGTDSSGNLVTNAEPGTFELLPPGVKFQPWDPSHPSTAFGDFVKNSLRGISAGLGVNYSSLANDYEGVSYSSLRAEELVHREIWMRLQNRVSERFHARVYQQWLPRALLAGIPLPTNGLLRPEDIDRYQRVSWQGPRWPWVDPLKEMQANREAVSLGVRSRSDIIRGRGQDPEEVWQELEQERDRLRDLGVDTANPAAAGFFDGGGDDDEQTAQND